MIALVDPQDEENLEFEYQDYDKTPVPATSQVEKNTRFSLSRNLFDYAKKDRG